MHRDYAASIGLAASEFQKLLVRKQKLVSFIMALSASVNAMLILTVNVTVPCRTDVLNFRLMRNYKWHTVLRYIYIRNPIAHANFENELKR